MFHSISFAAKNEGTDFGELIKRSTTPKGMNEQAGKEIRDRGAHKVYRIAVDHLFERFI